MSNNKLMCFSNNVEDVRLAFTDYMNQYMSEVQKRDGFIYDKSLTFGEKEKIVNKLIKDEISRLSQVNFDENQFVSFEMWAQHPTLKWASFAVINSLVDMIVPTVLDKSLGLYTEMRFGSMGDSFAFDVESNDLFYVSKMGRNQRQLEFQRQFEGQVTVIPEARGLTVSVNLYRTLCGLDSIAKFVTKAILSLELQITKDVYSAFNTAMTGLPTTPTDGALKVTGYSKSSAIKLAQTVTAFNGGAQAIFLGTQLALANILPDGTNYRYDIDSDFVKVGYVRNAFGYDTMVMPQIADINDKYKLALDDKKIYVISPSSQKPIKLCYEGSTITRNIESKDHADLSQSVTLVKSYGIAVATNAIAGLITLS